MRLPLAALPVILLSACTVGPDFARPEAPSGQTYARAEDMAAVGPSATLGEGPPLRWWTAFGSPKLDRLVDRAIANNHALAAANATLRRANAELAAAKGAALPQVDAHARAEHQQINLAAMGFEEKNPEFGLYTVGAGVSYDLDLFGGRKRRIERAGAQAEAQWRQTQAAHLALAGRVVNQAMALAAIRARIDTATELVREGEQNVSLTDRRRRAGEGTMVEVLNAQSQLAADRADLAPLRQQLAEARNMLAVLVGEMPADADIPSLDLDAIAVPGEVPVTLPSELVHKRPDILQAEAEFHAATAAIGIAEAARYPDITLGANIAQAAPGTRGFLTDTFRGYDIFAGLTAPIFHGGTLKAREQAAVAEAEAAQALYRQTVIEAFGQVADMLAALGNDANAVRDQQDAVDVARKSLHLSRRSFEVGNSGILQVLDSERIYQRALSGLVEARARQLRDIARLYVATAGGWTGPSGEDVKHAN